jgi:glutathione S-transferase
LTANLKSHFDFLESQLATSPDDGKYLCGPNLTGADILMSFPLIAAKISKKFDKPTHPKLSAYIDLLESSEGYKISVKKIEELTGEPFKAL